MKNSMGFVILGLTFLSYTVGAEEAPGTGSSRPVIQRIEARVQDDQVVISFSPEQVGTPCVLYRSTTPITTTRDILSAVIIQSDIQTSPFIDYPIPGLPSYYALLEEKAVREGRLELVPGKNTTIVPAEIPPGTGRIGLPPVEHPLRNIPLPYIASLEYSKPGILFLGTVPVKPLSNLTQKALQALPQGIPPKPLQKSLRILPPERESSTSGEAYQLQQIVQEYLIKEKWEEALKALGNFLSLRRSAEVEGRAYFYRGETYYFMGAYEKALFAFLLAQTTYPRESSEWIQGVMQQLVAQRK
ncbi:MAG: tetratricopeptide repeat protein [Treponemataceae bacterium]|nr:tetratricopeptide repeat protein [Treponemataceae bacterium]